MPVLLNKWDGRQFESNDIRCDFCRRHATVKEITVGDCIGHICKGCLLGFVSDIDQAILEGAIKSVESIDIVRAVFEFKENQKNQKPVDFVVKEVTRP